MIGGNLLYFLIGLIFCGFFFFGTGYSDNNGFGKEVVGEVKRKIVVFLF